MSDRDKFGEPGGRRQFLAALAIGSVAATHAPPSTVANAELAHPSTSDIDLLLTLAQREYPDRLTTEEWAMVRKQIADNQQAATNLARVPLDWTLSPVFFPSVAFDSDVAQ